MGIRTECPNGHVFKVKEKYAGKKGFCPYCDGKVPILVPDFVSVTEDAQQAIRQTAPRDEDASVFDDHDDEDVLSSGPSRSVLTGSVIRHKVSCPHCSASVPMWYAKCPTCGRFMDQR